MLKFVVLLCAVSCALGAAIPDGMLPQLDGRIVGGDAINIRLAPYQISVLLNLEHVCGGTIYNRITVITAAHCTQNNPVYELAVRAGSSFSESGGTFRRVDTYRNHEDYNVDTNAHDISVIKLSSPLTISSDIQPIALATTTPAHGVAAIISGWGDISNDGISTSQLRSAQVNIVSREACGNSTYGYGSRIKQGMICAWAEGKDSCHRDSGGPLAIGRVLVGVSSWGSRCADPYYPGVYTDVASHRSWIMNNTWNDIF